MKKIKYLLLSIMFICVSGCFNDNSMEHIKITTTIYPIQYVIESLYSNHSEIYSIYPTDSNIANFEVTDTLLEQYKENELYVFNSLSNEDKYIKKLADLNHNLKIIDATANMDYTNSVEELWLDPNNLLTIAYNIKKGFNEYIQSTYLKNEIDENYNILKLNLTTLDGQYFSTVGNASNKVIIVSDDIFKYLEKYGLEVISLDVKSVSAKDKERATELLKNHDCNYIYIKYGEETNDLINDILSSTKAEKIELYTMTNLKNIDIEKNDYISLMNQNLENLKKELYK